ncbi:MAG: c(7)-type cytochrome triheme domain-containing protein [Thermoleophilia bacterium]
MKIKLVLLPVLLATLAVGFILYRGTNFANDIGFAEEISAAAGYTDAGGTQYGHTRAPIAVPADIIYTKNVAAVAFSHETHAVSLQFKCDTCHTGIFQMQAHAVESRPDFNMAGLASGKYCGVCHSGKKDGAFASDSQCARCHIGVKGLERVEAGNG